MVSYDMIIVGGGHNGLTCGAYLAKAGLKVLVLERNPKIGGGCSTEEMTLPGFKHNLHSVYHIWIFTGPVYRDLELNKYGYKPIENAEEYGTPFSDGKCMISYLSLDKTCKMIERFSKNDARTYRQFHEKYRKYVHDIVIPAYFSPPSPPSVRYSLLEKTDEGRELMRIMQMSPRTAVEELFEDDRFRAHMLFLITVIGLPDDYYGTGHLLPTVIINKHEPFGTRVATGGSNTLTVALQRVIEANEGTVLLNSQVDRITVKDGAATGVQLADGKLVEARKAVVSSLEPAQTFLKLVGAEHLQESFVGKVLSYKYDELSLVGIHLALNEPPKYPKASEFEEGINRCLAWNIGYEVPDDFSKHWASIRKGEPPDMPGMECAALTLFDPTQAPAGKHTALAWQFAPYDLAEGGPDKWDDIKLSYAEKCMDRWREYAPNLTKENILGLYIHTPLDTERYNINMVKGGFNMGRLSPDQLGYFRPFPELSNYRTPIKNFYLCGAFTHLGGSIGGSPGYNAANIIAEDLKIQKWWQYPYRVDL